MSTDAFEGNSADVYYNALLNMALNVRSRYEKIPFIAGDFVNEWKSANIEICEPIIQAIRQVIKDCGNAVFVETADLLSNNQKVQNGDPIHFCRESLHILGRRYFLAYSKLEYRG